MCKWGGFCVFSSSQTSPSSLPSLAMSGELLGLSAVFMFPSGFDFEIGLFITGEVISFSKKFTTCAGPRYQDYFSLKYHRATRCAANWGDFMCFPASSLTLFLTNFKYKCTDTALGQESHSRSYGTFHALALALDEFSLTDAFKKIKSSCPSAMIKSCGSTDLG
jgi:hypothetical protein